MRAAIHYGALLAVALAYLGAVPGLAQNPPAGTAQGAAAASGYAGDESCQGCHDDVVTTFARSPHRALLKGHRNAPEGQSCESCHGPGAKHAESASPDDIRNPGKMHGVRSDVTCLSCHANQVTRGGRIAGGHGRNQVSCATCHTVHGPVRSRAALRTEQCATCHISERAEFNKPHRHSLQEGAVACADCHNPHGSFQRSAMRTWNFNEPGCFKCHSDKRGPFTFEHAPVKTDGCGSCHEPHGSANPRMLVRAEVSANCLECHSNIGSLTGRANGPATLGGVPPAFHDLRNPRYRQCTVCHVKVHGSHVNRSLLR